MDSAKTKTLIPLAATLIISLVIFLHPKPTAGSSSLGTKASMYEILDDNNFPTGLLPLGVSTYQFNITTRRFTAYFNRTCHFTLQNNFHVKYKTVFQGSIANGFLSGLKGLYVRKFLAWREIRQVVRREDDLLFFAKIFTFAFPLDYFEETVQCRCFLGICDEGQHSKAN